MRPFFQIVIPKRTASCFHCKAAFAEGQEIQSQLMEKKEGWLRQDVCVPCFTPLESAIIWKHTMGGEEKVLPEHRDHISHTLKLLQELIVSEEVSAHEEAYLLALYLVRQKVLVHRIRAGLYENLETGEMYLVPKIDFADFSPHAVQLRLQEKI